ncbi:capsular polysaccharide biosynthesis protein [Sinobaca qinghaiensis]|uniref:Capsular polysaccharide biosynthesis protein n=1 Tax=Sinobaca qinghaiensis TaxID=342944 RepID=A0A419V8C6_9BACL|nr:Wzz/FepE/Etk N-terminal domain-containing protein [Sinobaca qinghaiensis]RKD76312.1 capsular polysaccharide biosynthesis protein [Sinobaca qinghaiensis]
MEETISLKEIGQILKKRMKLITVLTLSALMLAVIFTFFIATPQYQASTQILVNQTQQSEQDRSTINVQTDDLELINTYNVIITSPAILDLVLEETNLDTTVSNLQSKITVAAEEQSQVVSLTVEDENPQIASELANTIAEVFEQEVPNIMNIDNVSILSEAQAADSMSPVSPQPSLNFALALAIGLIFGIMLAFLIEFLDQSLKTEQDLEKFLNLPILGSVSIINKELDNEKQANSNLVNKKTDSNKKTRKTS